MTLPETATGGHGVVESPGGWTAARRVHVPTPSDDERAAERAVRVSTLELFFDLVFAFTLTQFTWLLAGEPSTTRLAEVIVLFSVTWYAYDSFAWLTNALALDVLAYRLLLLEGMAAFLIMALAIPSTFNGGGVAFAIAYVVVVLLHSALFMRATSAAEARAMRGIAPYNVVVALLVLGGGIAGGVVQWTLMLAAGAVLWSSGLFISLDGFRIATSHFVERPWPPHHRRPRRVDRPSRRGCRPRTSRAQARPHRHARPRTECLPLVDLLRRRAAD
jgi:low temperature requirement protein LtrA